MLFRSPPSCNFLKRLIAVDRWTFSQQHSSNIHRKPYSLRRSGATSQSRATSTLGIAVLKCYWANQRTAWFDGNTSLQTLRPTASFRKQKSQCDKPATIRIRHGRVALSSQSCSFIPIVYPVNWKHSQILYAWMRITYHEQ